MTPGASALAGTGRARLLVALAALCFGTTGTAQALLTRSGVDASAVSLGAARIVGGGAVLAVLALLVRRRTRRFARPLRTGRTGTVAEPESEPEAKSESELKSVPVPESGPGRVVRAELGAVVLGGIAVAAYQPAFFLGVERTGVALGTLVALGSAPVLTGLLQWAVLGRRPGARWAAATALAAVGVAVIALTGPGGARADPLGLLAALGAGTCYAVFTLTSKTLLDRGRAALDVVGATFGAAAMLLLPVLAASGAGWLLTGPGALAAGWLALVPTALAYVLFTRGLAVLPAAEVATTTLLEPVTAAALGLLVLAEPFGVGTATGAALLMAGLVVLSARARRPAPSRTPRRAARPGGSPRRSRPAA